MNLSKFSFFKNPDVSRKSSAGYTLLEVLIVMGIVGILAAVAMPAFNDSVANSRMGSNANLLIGALNLARIEAIKRSGHVVVEPVSGTDWNSGINVYLDNDRNTKGLDDDVDLILKKVTPVLGDGNFSNSDARVTFLSTGFISTETSFELCDGRTGETGRTISLLISGRIRNSDKTCS